MLSPIATVVIVVVTLLLQVTVVEGTTPLTNARFKQATWDWVQNATTATHTWGDIGDWDVSGVKDFSYAFSNDRNVMGTNAKEGNPKVVTFVGTGMSKWITTSVTSLFYTFQRATAMNADLSGWTVAKVASLQDTFAGASEFTGTGLSSWDTTSVTTMISTFSGAREMNSDLSGWKVGKVTSLWGSFSRAFKFIGTGLGSWDTASVKSLDSTFYQAREMNFDLSGWKVGAVTTLHATFKGASAFAGIGLDVWDVASVVTMKELFSGAIAFNNDLSSWNVRRVDPHHANRYVSGGMRSMFATTTSLSSCNRRHIADSWVDQNAIAFESDPMSYNTKWADEKCSTCPPRQELHPVHNHCSDCTVGTSKNTTSADPCTPCAQGRFQSDTGEKICRACEFGRYQNTTGASSCTLCGPNTIHVKIGQTSSSSCEQCPEFTTPSNAHDACLCTDPCGAGAYGSSPNCVPCPAGTYFPVIGARKVTDCAECPTGTWSDKSGLKSLMQCKTCSEGYFGIASGQVSVENACEACAPGQFQDKLAEVSCKFCLAGKYGDKTAQTSEGGACKECLAGKVEGPGPPHPCRPSLPSIFDPNPPLATAPTCRCSLFIAFSRSFPCSLRFTGTYSPVPGANNHTLCNECPTARWGNRNIDRSSLSHCVPCEPGRSGTQSGLTDIATACVVCAPGRFQESPESASCEACQAGSYGDKVGQVRAVDACK